ncbi:MAG: hypothetical protein ACLS5G_00750 [Streptococcus sp.]
MVTAAKPKIGAYHFTTIVPNLEWSVLSQVRALLWLTFQD